MKESRGPLGADAITAVGVLTLAGLWLTLWAASSASSALSGHGMLALRVAPPFAAFAHFGNPQVAWEQPAGPPWLYWSITIVFLSIVTTLALSLWGRRSPSRVGRSQPLRIEGGASPREVAAAAGARRLTKRSSSLRPALAQPRADDLGHRLGRARGVDAYASIEDSVVVVGPPRSGKGLHLAIPMILDSPGAVLTTSTRPDNLTATLRARESRGPVAVFDPQRLAPGIPSATRWSPIRGCDDPHVAMVRATALTTGMATGTTDSSFWQASAEQAVRCLLHAAALGGCTATDLYRWSLSAIHAREAVMILSTHPGAAMSWHQALEGVVMADPRQRDSVWAMVTLAFSALADPKVLDTVSPGASEHFEPERFLRENGTVYLLGTSTGKAATAGLVGAFVEDVVEAARRVAARSPGARLDPPLALILDEAANYPLPSLPSLMSEGGGTGISTIVALQSLSQARAVWGEHAASAIWDAAIVKVILGGGSNARDLEDLSKLIGQRSEKQTSMSVGWDGRRTTSTTTQQVPIIEPGSLRTLPFGSAILLLRSARPIALALQPWIARKDAKRLQSDRMQLEGVIHRAHLEAAKPASRL
jgi:type IV secretion system protein VirD4